jgi:hypothetical protein
MNVLGRKVASQSINTMLTNTPINTEGPHKFPA